MKFQGAKDYIVNRLRKELPVSMVYHTLEHTLDVLKVAKQLIIKEQIDPQTSVIILTAALFHDAGMLINYKDHEIASVDIARNVLPDFSYSSGEIADICSLIMVTKLPQRPESYEGQLLCDADMDNLGREDFFIQSFRLKLELELNGIATSSLKMWLSNLVQFLEDHKYYTKSAIEQRQQKKVKNLTELKEIVLLF